VVEDGDRHLVYMLNVNHQPTSVRLRARRGRIARVTNLVTALPGAATLHLDSMQVALLAVEVEPR